MHPIYNQLIKPNTIQQLSIPPILFYSLTNVNQNPRLVQDLIPVSPTLVVTVLLP